MKRALLVAVVSQALCLGAVSCGRPSVPSAATPVGVYSVANVSDVVARSHAQWLSDMNDVLRTMKNPTKDDEMVGLKAGDEYDVDLTNRLSTARVTLQSDGTFSWNPSPIVIDRFPSKVSDGRWSLADHRVTLRFERLDDVPLPAEMLGTWEGDELRLGDLSGIRSSKGLGGIVLRRRPP